jgi:hypothetical protein
MVKSKVAVLLPGDPTTALGVATKQYVDTGVAARALSSHTHAASDVNSGTLAAARLPLVLSTPQTITYAASLTLDPTVGNNQDITATGALALAISTTGVVNKQMLLVEVLASGGARIVTLNAAIVLTSGLIAAPSIPSGKVGLFGFRYSALLSAWMCIAQTVTL